MMFSLLLTMGAVIGLGWSAVRAPSRNSLQVVDQGLFALLGAMVGARAGYVAVNWGYFQNHLVESWQIWLGGLSGVGAVFGFSAAVFLLSFAAREHPGIIADRLLPLGISIGASAWLAAWWAGSAYGIQSIHMGNAGWFALPSEDESGIWSLRWPTQLAGALSTLAVGVVIERLKWADPACRAYQPGRAAACALFGIGVIFFALAYTRVDPTPFWRGVRLDAWGGIVMMALGLVILFATSLPFAANTKPEL